ncbi:microfibril-associated glycoprotein 4-like [Malaya genurostris]|uniref:microfibril-associated glycoprotein 4-like n=1 Tax=Malaya genurostris TaxID=325434 RepID=UPI0026F3E0EC|nr:microfibril-associated glycoprotein 4-like [Malaya genurostris]
MTNGRFLVVLVLASCNFLVKSSENQEPSLGLGMELVLTKLEQLELRLIELEQQNQLIVDLLNGTCVKTLCDSEKPIQSATESTIAEPKIAEAPPEYDEKEVYSSCYEVPIVKPGKYLLKPTETSKPFYAFCDVNPYGEGWMVVQYRFNGSESFYRNWTDYKHGFGSLDGEFWYGLERIRLFTATRRHELMFELVDSTGMVRVARYYPFTLGSEEQGYSISAMGPYIGNGGDSFGYHSGMKFTTYDRDNDESTSTNCAKKHYGAWWYKSCHRSNLNGRYMKGSSDQSMSWNTFRNAESLKRSKIMIREG